MSIKFIRIDDRLIHGQVVTAWIKSYQAKKVIIVDDIVAKDDFLIGVMEMVKPSGIKLEVVTVEDFTKKLPEYDSESVNSVVLVKTPKSAKKCFDAGLKLDSLNVGGMGAKEGRKQIYRNVSASDDEIAILLELKARGIDTYLQATPNDKKVEVTK